MHITNLFYQLNKTISGISQTLNKKMDEQAKRQDENQNTHPLPNHSLQNTPLHEPGAGGQTHKLEHPT